MANELVKQDSLTLWDLEGELVEAYRDLEELRESDANSDDIARALNIYNTYMLESRNKRDAVGNILQYVEDLECNTDKEIERLQAKKAKLAKGYERMCNYILSTMEANQLTEIQGKRWTFKARKNPPSVEVVDELSVGAEYLYQPAPPPPKVDKNRVAEDLKQGKEVPGCRLINKKRLVIE